MLSSACQKLTKFFFTDYLRCYHITSVHLQFFFRGCVDLLFGSVEIAGKKELIHIKDLSEVASLCNVKTTYLNNIYNN
jgi:hypothetical protein